MSLHGSFFSFSFSFKQYFALYKNNITIQKHDVPTPTHFLLKIKKKKKCNFTIDIILQFPVY